MAAITDDITHLIGLAGDRRVEGLKGYRLDFAYELSTLPDAGFFYFVARGNSLILRGDAEGSRELT